MRTRAVIMIFCVVLTTTTFALNVSTVLGSGGGAFDPWNQTRWAAWYSGSNLVKQFDIDCNVTFVDRGGSSNPWEPNLSGHETGTIFYLDNNGRGVTVEGSGVFIDTREEFLGVKLDIAGFDRCFRISQGYSDSYGPTIIRNLWMKGFVQAIRTSFRSSQSYHPLIIECDFRRNDWGVYLSGSNATVQHCGIKQQFKGGMYLGAGSHSNTVIENAFQDNQYGITSIFKDYADIIIDTSYDTLIENNTHLQPSSSGYQCGIKFYRNMGEDDTFREHYPHDNIIRNNTLTGYSVGYDIGARMGRNDTGSDISGEGRDYACYNMFENNTLTDTTIGFKVNCPANTIRGNTFNNVDKPIALHCVFYSLTETVINDQAGDNVYFWFTTSDYSSYSNWFSYQDDLNGSIPESEKLIHVRSDYGSPTFENYTGDATVVIEKSLLLSSADRVPDLSGDQYEDLQDIAILAQSWLDAGCDLSNDFCDGTDLNYDGTTNATDLMNITDNWLLSNNMKDVYAAGVTPIDIAVGDYWVDIPGDEIAVIWDSPVSRIGSTNYYSIIMYDSAGIEISRCGRSTTQWQAITSGNFVNLVGNYSVVESGDEIAAVPASAIGGYYPVYVFGRGRMNPSATLLSTNTTKIVDLAGGNFRTLTDSNDEIAVIYTGGSSSITYCKPTETTWTAGTSGTSSLTKIAAGNFDGNAGNGDEIAGISNSTSTVFFYQVGGTSHYITAAGSGLPLWSNIAAGDFDPSTSSEEIAVSSSAADSGIYTITYYAAGSSAFKQSTHDVIGVPVGALSAGKPVVHSTPSFYERAKGFYSTDYDAAISGWGDFIAVLPSAPQTTGTPVFWLLTNSFDQTQSYLKVTPIMR